MIFLFLVKAEKLETVTNWKHCVLVKSLQNFLYPLIICPIGVSGAWNDFLLTQKMWWQMSMHRKLSYLHRCMKMQILCEQKTILMIKVKETTIKIFLIWSYKYFDVFIEIYYLLSFLFNFCEDTKFWANYRSDTI